MEQAAETWTGEWWKYGGGGTAWDAMAFDPELDLLYVGTGNGSPWNRDVRSPEGGDNLYLSSIVALNPDTGALVWHYQTTPGDTWDYTATQHIILADLEIEGKVRKVLMQAPKNGFFYVLDRTNGEFISAQPYVYTNWAKEVDQETGRPIETELARYPETNAIIAPSAGGGHNWQPMAYHPGTKLVYIPAKESSMPFGQPTDWEYDADSRSWNTAASYNPDLPMVVDTIASKSHGKLIAWNPVKQEEVWYKQEKSDWNSGVLATPDLIFQGNGEGEFMALDAENGDVVWSYPLKTGIIAAPVTYEIDGTQYVSILAGWGGFTGLWNKFTEQINPGTLYTFALGGDAPFPDFPKVPEKKLINLAVDATAEEIANGAQLYGQYCWACHGIGTGSGGGIIPDLKYSSEQTFNAFQQIVGQGALSSQGMPDFDDRLNERQIADIKHYILSEAKALSPG